MVFTARDRKMIINEGLLLWLLELGNSVCSLGDMIFTARDRRMIINESFLLWLLELGNIDSSLGDMIFVARDRKMITKEGLLLCYVFYFDCLELRIDVYSLGDMIFAARDRKMITKEGLLLCLLELEILIILLVTWFLRQGTVKWSLFGAQDWWLFSWWHVSFGKGRKMIANECLLLWLFGGQNFLFVIWVFRQGTVGWLLMCVLLSLFGV